MTGRWAWSAAFGAALASAGCASHAGVPSLGKERTAWTVLVLAATGDRTIEATYALATERVAPDRWLVSTTRTRGTWAGDGEPASYDSDAPTAADPWPLTLQHLIASVPVEVRVDDGHPVALVDPDGWADAARHAVYASDLPNDALAVGQALVDPDGLLADLGRTFPGTPGDGAWARPDRIGGVDAVRTETCARPTPGSWDCAGTAEATPDAGARLFEVATTTTVATDRRGLVRLDARYTGTLVTLAPSAHWVDDRPVSGIRQVERAAAP